MKEITQEIRSLLNADKRLTRASVEKIGRKYGIANKTELKEITELATCLNARDVADDSSLTLVEKYSAIVGQYMSQTNSSLRTSQSVMMQQYSTPTPISFLASTFILASSPISGCKAVKKLSKGPGGNTNKDCVKMPSPLYFEPSAGNGMMTVALPYENTIVNELDSTRLAMLKEQPFYRVLNEDATLPFSDLIEKCDGVITNPPFGKIDKVDVDGFMISSLEQFMAINALRTMKDSGKAAIIIGGHTEWDNTGRIKAGKNRIFYNYLHHHFNVVDSVNLDGKKLYARQGTSIKVRMILIDGRKPKPSGFAPFFDVENDHVVDSFEMLFKRINKHLITPEKARLKDASAIAIAMKMQLSLMNMQPLGKLKKTMRILVACEESQVVTIALRKLGHEAYSCDLKECSGGHPEWHIKGDVLQHLDKGWDMMIGHPPCLYLTITGNRAMSEDPSRLAKRKKALVFVRKLMNAPIPKIAIENPVGVISSQIRKPDQIVQPFFFGDKAMKTTCLWLKNLPLLKRTHNNVTKEDLDYKYWYDRKASKWKRQTMWYYKTSLLPLKERSAARSKTFPKVAKQMAQQWTK